MKKVLINTSIIVLLLGLLEGMAGVMLEQLKLPLARGGASISAKVTYLNTKKPPIKVAFIGSSRMHYGGDPRPLQKKMWPESGETHVYNLALNGSSMETNYLVSKWLLKYFQVQTLVVSISEWQLFEHYSGNTAAIYEALGWGYAYRKVSLNMRKLWQNATYQASLYNQHQSAWSEYEQVNLFSEGDIKTGLYQARLELLNAAERELEIERAYDNMRKLGLNFSPRQMNFARKIAQLCQRKNIQIIWVYMPVRLDYFQVASPEAVTQVEEFAQTLIRPNQAWYINMNKLSTYEDALFWDNNHLTPEGASVFGQKFADWVSEQKIKLIADELS